MYQELSRQESAVDVIYFEQSSIDNMDELLPLQINPVNGIMNVKQVWALAEPGQILTKYLSCFCSWPTPCSCYEHKASIALVNQKAVSSKPKSADVNSEISTVPVPEQVQFSKEQDLRDKWVIMNYDSKPYVGKVISQDCDSVEVQELKGIGNNKFVMPDNDDLTLWYDYEKLLATIPPPKQQTRRLLSIDSIYWNKYFEWMAINRNPVSTLLQWISPTWHVLLREWSQASALIVHVVGCEQFVNLMVRIVIKFCLKIWE